ncbi:hypothetical protein U5801_19010 [Lamprobacter modestohalophilus]|uniref:Uncharacterized protein n=1 Tax=Lamprobacter modestohalophilus TaxID=1064514 RepID=A0A9X1B3G6_9GAMM|nr:hypothetical protein [Lamprobacter modestohalophilus]MBK1618448.1 hypothetical protein [Lamprobacter modestohalophilus]MEA1051879.1 hypothetical protein [Lamprobacter modestohalophilus]
MDAVTAARSTPDNPRRRLLPDAAAPGVQSRLAPETLCRPGNRRAPGAHEAAEEPIAQTVPSLD